MSILRRIQSGDQSNPQNGQQQNGNSIPANASGNPTNPLQAQHRILSNQAQSSQDTYQDLKTRVQTKLLSEIDPSVDVSKV